MEERSNRGRSPLKPTRAERDAVVQAWLDRKDLATIGLYMESKGIRIKHMSDILRFAVETTRTLVLKSNGTYVDSTAKATAYLEDRTEINLNKQGKAKKNLATNLLFESGVTEDEVVPVIPKANIDEKTIAEIKRRAVAQFAQGSDGDLLISREEKDTIQLKELEDTFKTLPDREI